MLLPTKINMKRPHIITLSGKPGSGKSSTSDKVAELLGYTRYSAGDSVRNIIKEKDLTLSEYNELAADKPEMDHTIDEQLRLLRNESDIVIDSRLGFYWIPESFKVYLNLDIEVSTARIYKDLADNKSRMESGEQADSISEMMDSVKSRLKNEEERFIHLYGIDPYQTEHFDLIINTANHSPQTVAMTILAHYDNWLKSETWNPVTEKALEPDLTTDIPK